jgi:hypothetical protein
LSEGFLICENRYKFQIIDENQSTEKHTGWILKQFKGISNERRCKGFVKPVTALHKKVTTAKTFGKSPAELFSLAGSRVFISF